MGGRVEDGGAELTAARRPRWLKHVSIRGRRVGREMMKDWTPTKFDGLQSTGICEDSQFYRWILVE